MLGFNAVKPLTYYICFAIEQIIGPLTGVLSYLLISLFTYRKACKRIPIATTRSQRETHARRKAQEKRVLMRHLLLCLLIYGTAYVGSYLFAQMVRHVGGYTSDFYLDGGIAAAVVLSPLYGKLLLPKGVSIWKEAAVVELTAVASIWVVKIGCMISQNMDGKVMRWGIPVFSWVPLPEGSRIFPFNLIFWLIMTAALTLSLLWRRRGALALLVFPASFTLIFPMDFLVGWEPGHLYLGMHLLHYCHLVIIVAGFTYAAVMFAQQRKTRLAAKTG